MICFELTGIHPHNCSPYYTICVRGHYSIGRLDSNDIFLDAREISRQHASVTVTVLPEFENSNKNRSGLSATLVNHSKFGTIVDDVLVNDSAQLYNGTVISFGGSHVDMRVTFRPVIVSLTSTQYTPGYVASLKQSLRQLGAQVLDGPPIPSDIPSPAELRKRQLKLERERGKLASSQSCESSLEGTQVFSGTATSSTAAATAIQELLQDSYERPLCRVFCCEEIDDSSDTLLSLALGFSIVQPSYVFELFALVAEDCKRALHELQHPQTLQPPISKNTYGALTYLRPEYSAIPFSLYEQPKIGVNRSRQALLARRSFCFHTPAMQLKLGMVIAASGGKVILHIDEADPLKHAPIYLVVQSQDFETMCADVHYSDAALSEAQRLSFTVISEHTVSAAVLTNQFAPVTLASVRGAMMAHDHHYHTEGSARFHHLFNHHTEEDEKNDDAASSSGSPSKKLLSNNTSMGGRPLSNDSFAELGEGYFSKRRHFHHQDNEEEENDSDATPSDIGSDRGGWGNSDAAAADDDINDGEQVDLDHASTSNRSRYSPPLFISDPKRFSALFEKMKLVSDRSIVPSYTRIKDISVTAAKNRFVSEVSVAYLVAVHDKCSKQLRGIEELSRSPDGNNHSQQLQRYWDICVKVQESIRRALISGRRQHLIAQHGMEAQAPPLASTATGDAYLFDPAEQLYFVEPSMPGTEDERHRHFDPSGGHFNQQDGVIPARSPPPKRQQHAEAADVSPQRPASLRDRSPTQHSGGGNPSAAVLPRGTRLARYFPPPPVKARIHAKPPRKVTLDDADSNVELAHLWIHITPSDLKGIRNHRGLFTSKYGGQEGGQNFRMWLQSQTVDWTSQFHQTLEASGISVTQLFSDDIVVQLKL